MAEKIMVGMSGGVDSAVSAYWLREAGYDVTGGTLSLFPENGTAEMDDAAQVAAKMGIPHRVVDLSEAFYKKVIDAFVDTYIQGGTPNPCIVCNRHIKFGDMLSYAASCDVSLIGTGHYARIERDGNGRFLLKRAADAGKDQSYVLYSLTQHQLAHTRFPLGSYCKSEIREIAEAQGFVNARKHDSQDICFVPDGDYVAFIERYTGKRFPCGHFIDQDGKILGQHNGMIRYTVGQRKGLGIALGKPAFVCAKNAADNTVTLGNNEDLFSTSLTARDVNLIACDNLHSPVRVTAKIRYGQSETAATVEQIGDDRIRVAFDQPQRAIAKGQSVVLYDGETVVGGGIIE
ncbi:MAG: tRNA 2-thiouridine(34) synthase MnmA [Clostridia bacterium]|nr:tRNA 2-thiouridine(34) synthase MnmA [Clostridia bacterium]